MGCLSGFFATWLFNAGTSSYKTDLYRHGGHCVISAQNGGGKVTHVVMTPLSHGRGSLECGTKRIMGIGQFAGFMRGVELDGEGGGFMALWLDME